MPTPKHKHYFSIFWQSSMASNYHIVERNIFLRQLFEHICKSWPNEFILSIFCLNKFITHSIYKKETIQSAKEHSVFDCETNK